MTDRIERLAAEYASSQESHTYWLASAADFQAGYRRALADMQAMDPPRHYLDNAPAIFRGLMAAVAKELENE